MTIIDKKEYLTRIEQTISEGPFYDTWDSLTNFEMPSWFTHAKFGIFIHWGLYSVPAFDNEWYSRNMYVKGSPAYEHHLKTYGPHNEFGYKDFIPLFTAQNFDADYWADLFADAGAKYVVPVAEHHDGFQMYQSALSNYNAAQMGPKRDILQELQTAFHKRGLLMGASSHRAEHHWFMGKGKDFDSDIREPLVCGDFYWPSEQTQPDFQDLYAKPYPDQEFLTDWLLRTCELIDRYQPRILYFDWWIQHEAYKPYLRKIIAYYYNRGYIWNTPAAVCYKHDALAFGSGIVDVERGKFADAKPYHWQTDTAIARNSWCYTHTLEYKSSQELICYLIDVVSKNGNLLLNVGPKADGTFADEDIAILHDIGSWLAVNGEAIYDSKPWRTAQEGPAQEPEGQFSDGKAVFYTCQDFRFTAGNGSIYAICMCPPKDGRFTIVSLGETADANKPAFHGIIRSVEALGLSKHPSFHVDKEGLHVKTDPVTNNFPVVLKIMVE